MFWLFLISDRPIDRQTVNKKKDMASLSTSFLGPFPWRGKRKGPGTKVEHTVIYVLGQYSKRYRASFVLQVNVKNIFKKGRFMAV